MLPLLEFIASELAELGFVRRGRDFFYVDDLHTGEAVVNIQHAPGRVGVAFYVNVAAGPRSYLHWLYRERVSSIRSGAGGLGLWRSRIEVPPNASQIRTGELWQYTDATGLEAVFAELRAALASSVPVVQSLTDPRTFLGRLNEPTFRNCVTLRDPLADLLLSASLLPVEETLTLLRAHAEPEDRDFIVWLERYVTEGVF